MSRSAKTALCIKVFDLEILIVIKWMKRWVVRPATHCKYRNVYRRLPVITAVSEWSESIRNEARVERALGVCGAGIGMYDIPCRVWAFRNDCALDATELKLLNSEERAHASRLKSDSDRLAFAKTRAKLRTIVGSATGRSPAEITFSHNEWGKPFVEVSACPQFHFSVSHAKGLSAIALAMGLMVGVDVEPNRPCPDKIGITADVFGLDVAEKLLAVEKWRQDAVFLNLWTAGEAFVKASGLGFAGMNGRVPVCISDSGLLRVALRDDLRCDWSLSPLELGFEFTGHVVVGRHASEVVRDDHVELYLASGIGAT
jgi:4'-phosphopantetheinyl transferase